MKKMRNTLVMPASYAVMDSNEMARIEGGWNYTYSESNIAVPINRLYLSKSVCLSVANSIISSHGSGGLCNGMNNTRIAAELYSHALGYYGASTLIKMGIDNSQLRSLQSSGKTADIGLGDGRDDLYMQIWSGKIF